MPIATKTFLNRIRDSGGASAVEFALISPIMIVMFLSIIEFSMVLSVYSALQQIAAEAARAALPGMSATEQSQLASQYINGVMGNYPFLIPANLTVTTSSNTSTFVVTLSYNASNSFFSLFGGYFPSAPTQITRSAAIQLGGF